MSDTSRLTVDDFAAMSKYRLRSIRLQIMATQSALQVLANMRGFEEVRERIEDESAELDIDLGMVNDALHRPSTKGTP